ncbi:chemotaxis protein CheA [Pseudoalteromonas carrageenovora]|uniref:Chemotaxis protein CheA n=1 Tax=Pseudoalteromonas carrageenovora IAM 12662 TaxID=1314868 RepID=A0A2K4XBF5_PSEVC|nr:chemotaxis protein CheA [Pseudoalteromonas carrageenovora]MBE0383700.1 two-component system, chemotaxis family, sensor kinase CheA [Pseudoalteromonas carrageenovora IAM 12662]QBJ72523.1 chemotaxis protein CheA [Pseudoalteromonas carrageenovora]GEB71169.1 chemotaxis protein CheA [Pseudoalteromonas carrageenovora]SOU41645.1 Chemotaxis protein CheA [Pseudoalteromonas carrageenovora IAM 12662]
MSFEVDEDILQDFLVEAGEILELLSEQLVELENNPEDTELLNAIFRGFHTVKGGAGFLAMTELVDACHGAENVFDLLRQGVRTVNSELMDVILQALDTINEMFATIQNRDKPEPADPQLLETLHILGLPPTEAELAGAASQNEPEQPQAESVEANDIDEEDPFAFDELFSGAPSAADAQIDEITEDEFENLLDELHGKGQGPIAEEATASGADFSGDITDDEFDSLLDELHGVGSFGAVANSEPEKSNTAQAPVEHAKATPSDVSSSSDDEISDDEFEALLDELHGKGTAPKSTESAPAAKQPEPVSPPAAKQPEPVKKAEPAKAFVSKPVEKAPEKPAAKAPPAPKKAAPPPAETTVRVDTKRLDQIMNMVGELVLVRNRLVSLATNSDSEAMGKAISNLDVVTADIQGAVMQTRMQPIKKVFGRFPRVVRDLARSLNKDINLQLVGEETDLDKNLVEALADPLVHLVRNSVDHGIEMPAAREAAGKPRTGNVTLSASQEGDHILLTIKDDGAGMDAEKLKKIAISKGVLDHDQASRLSDTEAYNLIFAPGFSTKEEISDISGRGVGMDVVKTKITQLNGSVSIQSELGVGTILEIKVPLTLAILPTLMVIVGAQTFALPLAGVSEIFHLDLTKTNVVDGQLTIIVRKKAIPLFYLEHWLVKGADRSQRKAQGHVVIVQIGTQQVGFVVDSLIGQEEVVIKPLDALLQGTPGMAGATITSDGGIALILDVPSMLKHYAG